MSVLGENIKRLRNEKGWSLTVLSNKTEIPVSTLNGIEKGSKPSYDKIKKLSEVFDISMVELTESDTNIDENDMKKIKSEPLNIFPPSLANEARKMIDKTIDGEVNNILPAIQYINDDKYDLQKILVGDAFQDISSLIKDVVINRLRHYNNLYEKNNKSK